MTTTPSDTSLAEDFNTFCATRQSLLLRLDALYKANGRMPSFALQVSLGLSAIEDLEDILKWSEQDFFHRAAAESLEALVDLDQVFLFYRAKLGRKSGTPSLPRSQAATDLARDRDQVCILSGGSEGLQVAHIVPHFALQPSTPKNLLPASRRELLFRYLRAFWSRQTTTWQQKIGRLTAEPRNSSLQCSNLLLLAPTEHALWSQGAFALKPLENDSEDDKTTLRIQLFWQREVVKESHKPLSEFPQSTEGLEGYGTSSIYDIRRGRHLQSGDIVTLRTDDPERRPLPDYDLLLMQWNLNRVVAMKGGADETFVDYLDEWDDDGELKAPVSEDSEEVVEQSTEVVDDSSDVGINSDSVL